MRVIAALTLMAGLGMAGAAHALPIAPAGTEGRPVLLATTGVVSVTYQGTSASFTDQLFLASPAGGSRTIFDNQATPVGTTLTLGTFDAGTELLFGIDVRNTGDTFFTGDPSRNADGAAHARVQADGALNTILVSFEDLFGGRFDFNDLSFTVTVAPVASDIPEPLSLAVAGFGLLGLASLRRVERCRAWSHRESVQRPRCR